MSKINAQWRSERLQQDVQVVRWGEIGVPVLIFPTAGGDAEEIERFLVIDTLAPMLEAGRIKIYSCDSVAGKAWIQGDGSDRHRAWVQNQFHDFIYREVVAAIRMDCKDPDAEIIATGASIGAYNALAVLCRYPDAFRLAICMSGTYNLERFIDRDKSLDYYYSSPLDFVGDLQGAHLEALKRRFVLLASGQGRAEDIGESWRIAHLLGLKGIPNRVDPWGPEWHHDWPTWRRMLPQYLDEFVPAKATPDVA
jgi:esterase/lipase superfamily enzyme